MSNRIAAIDRTLRKGIYSLCESLYTEWPLPDGDGNEISEANLTIHVAHAFLSHQYSAYSEKPLISVSPDSERSSWHDLFMFLPGEEEYIIAEFKRFLKSDKTNAASDIKRIYDHGRQSKDPIIGIICFMTRDREVKNWWMSHGEEGLSNTKKSPSWKKLQEYLHTWKGNDAQIGYIHLPHHADDFYHAVVYSIFPVT
ncbi:MAG: hypothetical protein LAT61_11840 [Alcanivorax sp.]|nr:hypothetical protein [Alcanivorax sp.]